MDPLTAAVTDTDDAERFLPDEAARPPLPAPWAMSIRELDSWQEHYNTRLRGFGTPLTDEERAHRDEVLLNIAARHEARRHSYFTTSTAPEEVEIFGENCAEWLRSE